MAQDARWHADVANKCHQAYAERLAPTRQGHTCDARIWLITVDQVPQLQQATCGNSLTALQTLTLAPDVQPAARY